MSDYVFRDIAITKLQDQRLSEMAAKEKISVNDLIREVLDAYIERSYDYYKDDK